ncbi:TPA: undecaprenyl-diphosphate phosphatase [Candidatus Bathyarchaeota archaeon]|nr:undecaprenyl-diphosphate phosphatase [Candidatus Bathyarchaeota archaeon]
MLLETIIMGILQGLLEWLPISSQGNLVLFMVSLFRMNETEALSISVYLHAGTLLSALVYFRRTFWSLLKAVPSYRLKDLNRKENRLITFLVLSTLLTGIVGYPIFRFATAATTFGSVFFILIGASLILTGIAQKWTRRFGTRTVNDVNLTDSLLLGIIQGFSAFPGVSRSGMTVSFLLFRGLNSESALKLSFLMSVPAVLAAEIGLRLMYGLTMPGFLDIAVGCLSSFLVGMISISMLLRIARKINLWKFCIAIGVIAIISTL